MKTTSMYIMLQELATGDELKNHMVRRQHARPALCRALVDASKARKLEQHSYCSGEQWTCTCISTHLHRFCPTSRAGPKW